MISVWTFIFEKKTKIECVKLIKRTILRSQRSKHKNNKLKNDEMNKDLGNAPSVVSYQIIVNIQVNCDFNKFDSQFQNFV